MVSSFLLFVRTAGSGRASTGFLRRLLRFSLEKMAAPPGRWLLDSNKSTLCSSKSLNGAQSRDLWRLLTTFREFCPAPSLEDTLSALPLASPPSLFFQLSASKRRLSPHAVRVKLPAVLPAA